MLLNPIVAILHNNKENRWHPIIFAESPLPGPDTPDKPVRHRSKGHHTAGFESRAEAVTNINEKLVPELPGLRLALEADLEWDGDGIPASTTFFAEISGKLVPVL